MAKNEKTKTSKHKNKKCVIDEIKFDSIAEGDYYLKLKQKVKDRIIKSFELQPSFVLQEKFTHRYEGNIRAIIYRADFKVFWGNGYSRIIDVKGKATPDALLKRKIFMNKYPLIDLEWVAKSKKYSDTGWIDYFDLQKIRRENKKKKELLKLKDK